MPNICMDNLESVAKSAAFLHCSIRNIFAFYTVFFILYTIRHNFEAISYGINNLPRTILFDPFIFSSLLLKQYRSS